MDLILEPGQRRLVYVCELSKKCAGFRNTAWENLNSYSQFLVNEEYDRIQRGEPDPEVKPDTALAAEISTTAGTAPTAAPSELDQDEYEAKDLDAYEEDDTDEDLEKLLDDDDE